MRRITSFLCAMALLIGGLAAKAQSELISVASLSKPTAQTVAQQRSDAGSISLAPAERLELKVCNDTKLTLPSVVTPKRVKARAGQTRGGGLSNYYVGSYITLAQGSYDGGSTMGVVKDAAGDSITINYFWSGNSVRAHFDSASGTVTIPRQKIATDGTLGRLDLAVVNSDATPNYTTPLVGKIDADGTIVFDQLWAVFVQTGTNKDKFVGAYGKLKMQVPTGMMQYTTLKGAQSSYYVVVDQVSGNTLKVTNIFNRGLDVEMTLLRDRSATIENQTALKNSAGAWNMIACQTTLNDDGTETLNSYSTVIKTDVAAADNNTVIEWKDWSLLCAEAKSYAGRIASAKLTCMNPIKYPELSVSSFEGSGTESDPYLIKSRDHLILLADQVNNDTEYVGKYYNVDYTRTYLGKHFALANDIDLEGYRMDAIGWSNTQHFAGSLDGRGHKLSNLRIASNSSYAGLFGVVDTVSVIKNIVLEKPNIESGYMYSAPLAAWCLGTVENVTVIDPIVVSQRYGAGGVVAISGGSLKNCHVIDGTIRSAGYLGGVVGEVTKGIENCSAIGTQIYVSGSGYPAGGVVGNILNGDGDRLVFSGLLTYDAQSESQTSGGIAGYVQNATLRNSFSTGVLKSYSSDSFVGGVVAQLMGTIENCYSSGWIRCYSRKTSGLVGQIRPRPDFARTGLQPAVKNCYSSAWIDSETYQYDRNKCQEVIGEILETCEPVIENVYFDRNITNYSSTRFGSTTEELTSATGPKGFSADVWEFTEGAYPRIKALANTEAAKYSASAINFTMGDNLKKVAHETKLTALGNTEYYFADAEGKLVKTGTYANIEDGKLKIGSQFGSETVYVVNGSVQTIRPISVAPIPFEGMGSEDSPLLIKSKDDLIALSKAVTGAGQTFQGMHFAMTNDIDLELDPEFVGLATVASDAHNVFEGVFDGRGNTIHRMNIANRVGWSTVPTETKKGTLNTSLCYGWSGFVGRLGTDGVVRNLNIASDSKLEMYATCAAFVGQNAGLVENCRNYADVTGYSCWVGGIVGSQVLGGKVRNCYNAGNIMTCYMHVGGIVGSGQGLVENCVNTGDVKAISLITNYSTTLHGAGGIMGGVNGLCTISNCQNFGTIRATIKNTGGIVGTYSTTTTSEGSKTENCMNFGTVICGALDSKGAISGVAGTSTHSNVYFDAQVVGLPSVQNAPADGVTESLTKKLISGEALPGCGTEDWDYTAGVYPTLKRYASEPKVAAARKVIAIADDSERFSDLHKTIELRPGATWSLKNGSVFRLEGNTVICPESVNTVVRDSLIAVNELGIERYIGISSLPFMPLSGEGTEANPYLMKSVDDWAAFVTYMNATNSTFDGKIIKLAADLDFTGVATPARIGAITGIPFEGTFDGDNHVLKGLKMASTANLVGALFGVVNAQGVVKNFTVEGTMAATHTYIGSVVDKLYGTLENVTSKVDVTTTKTNAAGVVGNAYTGAKFKGVTYAGTITTAYANVGGIVNTATQDVSFENVKYTGTIKTTQTTTSASAVANIGGIACTLAGATFKDCVSDGTITVTTNDKMTTVAGFIATANGASGGATYVFENCKNATSVDAAGLVAGFIAKVNSTTTAPSVYEFTDCLNTGDISSSSTAAISTGYTAGLVTYYTPGSKYIRCVNEGTLSSNKNVYVGGIAANNTSNPTAAAPVEFTDCHNRGLIFADGNQGGGIVAYAGGAITIRDCSNTADIEGNQMVAGICSAFAGTGPQMINCYNTGNITAKQQRAAGLIAWGGPTNGVVEGCWNSGNIASTSSIQSVAATAATEIGGLAGSQDATFRNCYNVGKVTGLSRVGGLVGKTSKGKTSFYNCYNAGRVEAPADSCGAIVGVRIENNGVSWNSANVMENVYYLNEGTSKNDSVVAAATLATPISRRQLASLDLGEGFVGTDSYTHPVVKAFAEHEVALSHAAELILHENDSFEQVTKDFNVGGGSKVRWSSDCSAIAFDGNQAKFTAPFTGTVKMKAQAGDLVKEYTLSVKNTSGVESVAGKEIAGVRYYTPEGVEVSAPEAADGRVYVVVTTYVDGTTRTAKRVNR